MADKILNINMKIETAGPVGSQPKKLVSNTVITVIFRERNYEILRKT